MRQRLLAPPHGPESRPTSPILGYSDVPGAREAHSLIGTPDEIAEKLARCAPRGVACVLLSGQGSRDNLRRFAQEACRLWQQRERFRRARRSPRAAPLQPSLPLTALAAPVAPVPNR